LTMSIISDLKAMLGVNSDAFDTDLKIHINSALFVLNQVGVGPEEGFEIEGDGEEAEDWSDFLTGDDPGLGAIKTFVYLKVRLVFDPPTTSFVLEALTKQMEEYLGRIKIQVEGGEDE
jgi:hypothetical protein